MSRFLKRPVHLLISPILRMPESSYVKAQSTVWLARLASFGIDLDAELFEFLDWSFNDDHLSANLVLEAAKQVMDNQSFVGIEKSICEALKKGSLINIDIGRLLKDRPELAKAIRIMIVQTVANISKKQIPEASIFSKARQQLTRLFGVNKAVQKFCELVFINQNFMPIERYLQNHVRIWRFDHRQYLAAILGMSLEELKCTQAEAVSSGLVEQENYCCRLEKQLEFLWNERSTTEVSRLFCQPLKGKTIPLANFCLRKEDLEHATDLLRYSGDSPVHILLYGPPGTGKTTFAHSLTKVCGLKGWTVSSRDNDNDRDRRTSLTACLHMSAKHKGSFVLVDEAERLLDTNIYRDQQTKDKSWLNDLLEQPGRRIIWISNKINHIDQAVLRRFSFSLSFRNPGQKERIKIWQQIASQHNVKTRLKESQLTQLATDYQVPVAVIDGAVVQAKILGKTKEDFANTVECILQSYSILQRNGAKLSHPKKVAADFTPEGVCLEESLDNFMTRCRRVDNLMRSAGQIPAGSGTMLFYGPPGTDKTALARYVAKELNRECLVKRASDLLDCYLGTTEKLIAEAFQIAEDEESILIIDEADSFIYSRDIATRSWENTHVNEFLTALEECRSFCICTTNRRENLDPAAMRRFSHKLAFGYARGEQILALYNKLLAPLSSGSLTPTMAKDLLAMDRLTPGDFHAVRSQFGSIFSEETTDKIEQNTIIGALHRELETKIDRQNRRIGFLDEKLN